MKSKLLRTTLVALFSLSLIQVNAQLTDRSSKVDKIRIEYVSDKITTPVSIDCNGFIGYFDGRITTKYITDKHKIDSICKEFNSFLKRGKKYNEPPDVRMKITFFVKNHIVATVCNSYLLTSITDKYYINDIRINSFLHSIITTK